MRNLLTNKLVILIMSLVIIIAAVVAAWVAFKALSPVEFKGYKYTLTYPSGWEASGTNDEAKLVVLSIRDAGVSNSFIKVQVSGIDDPNTVFDPGVYANSFLDKLELDADANVVELGQPSVDSLEARRVIYKTKVDGNDQKNIYLVFIKSDVEYQLTLTSTPTEFEKARAGFESVVSSLKTD